MQSENIAKNWAFPICNLEVPTPSSLRARDFIGVANCRLPGLSISSVAVVSDRRQGDATIRDRRYSW